LLLSEGQVAETLADIAVRQLSGDRSYQRAVVVGPTAPTYDWRELRRWGIADSLLPTGSQVRYRPPSLWEAYRHKILRIIAIIALESALIGVLVIQRVRRQRAEAEVSRMSGRLISAHEDERRRLAGELHDDLSQRLARLAIDATQLEAHADPNGATTARS